MLTNAGRSGLALLIGGGSAIPRFCGIGTGSAAELATNTVLTNETGLRADFTTRDVGTPQEVTLTYDFNSVKMSGAQLKEFGIFAGSEAGSLFAREAFSNIEFDGTNELQVQFTFRIV